MVGTLIHRLLKRQLKRLQLDSKPPTEQSWQQLLQQISDTYIQADQDRYTLERSLTISSEETRALYQQLKASSEARMRAITAAFPDMLFFQDEEGRFLDIFTANPDQLLLPIEDILGHTIEEIFPTKWAAPFKQMLDETLNTGKPKSMEYYMDGPFGNHLYEARMIPMEYQENGNNTLLTVVRDITEPRKEQTWSRLISQAVSSAREGIIILDSQKNIMFANPAVETIVRQTPEALLHKNISVLRSHQKPMFDDKIWNAVKSDNSWHGDLTLEIKGKKPVSIWLSIDKLRLDVNVSEHYVILMNDISELQASRTKLQQLATTDPLTGLPNRLLFHDRLEQAMARTKRIGNFGALFFIDLDRFKIINDSLGHHTGDLLLQAVAKRINNNVRESDTLARMGGDEFTLIIEDLQRPEEIISLLEKLQQDFRRPFQIGKYELRTTASIGISIFPRDSDNTEELIKHADTAMYSAKEGGRDQYRFFTAKLNLSAYSYFETEQGLHQALKQNEFYLLYQPQYDLKSNALIGMEALLRWNRPQYGMVSPLKFIPMAEMTGLINSLGNWVRNAVCQQIVDWKKQGLTPPRVAVNLSSRELIKPGLNASIAGLLTTYRLPASALELEITESVIIERGDIAYQNLFGLTEMGIELAIDDFGTGHSSLVNLKRFPLSCLKIDRSFIRDLLTDENDEAIVHATIALAKSFGIKTIAEGVERNEQLDFLREAGCDSVQGFLCGRPMSPKGIARLLSSDTTSGKSEVLG